MRIPHPGIDTAKAGIETSTYSSWESPISEFAQNATPLTISLFCLYLTSFHSYLLFHSLAELFSIIIACGIFIIAWNAQRLLQNHYLLFIGIAYLYVGGIDILHTLAYKGMGVFESYDSNLPTQLWILGRYVEAISLLLSTIFLYRKLAPRLTFAAYGLSVGFLLASIFYWDVFPDSYIEGVGLTPFKIYSEYLICLVLLATTGLYVRNAKRLDRKVLILLVASMATTIVQELAFTTYLSVYGPSNMIGHLLKVVAFYLIYKAIIETSLISPWNLLFRELKQSEAKFRSLFETNVVPLAYCDMDGRVIDANDDYLKLLGFTKEELEAGAVRWDVVTPPEWKHVDETALQYLRRDGVCPPFEKEYLRRDGVRVPVLIGACRVLGDSGQVVAFAVDLSERKKMEDEIRRARDELELRVQERTAELALTNRELKAYAANLEALNRDLKDFTFIAAHDLQEPLRKIQVFSDLVLGDYATSLDDIGRDYLRRLASSANRIQELIRSVRDYSKLTAEMAPFQPVELKGIIEEAISDLEVTIEETGARIEIGDIPPIGADPRLMLILFHNLLSNALEYRNEDEPWIRISSREHEEGLQLTVEDNGIGFDETYADLIFKPFKRLHGRGEYKRTGMGLAICRKIVERHGGTITARSTPGKGSAFLIHLPLEQWSSRPPPQGLGLRARPKR